MADVYVDAVVFIDVSKFLQEKQVNRNDVIQDPPYSPEKEK
jgi:hypothetical protein